MVSRMNENRLVNHLSILDSPWMSNLTPKRSSFFLLYMGMFSPSQFVSLNNILQDPNPESGILCVVKPYLFS